MVYTVGCSYGYMVQLVHRTFFIQHVWCFYSNDDDDNYTMVLLPFIGAWCSHGAWSACPHSTVRKSSDSSMSSVMSTAPAASAAVAIVGRGSSTTDDAAARVTDCTRYPSVITADSKDLDLPSEHGSFEAMILPNGRIESAHSLKEWHTGITVEPAGSSWRSVARTAEAWTLFDDGNLSKVSEICSVSDRTIHSIAPLTHRSFIPCNRPFICTRLLRTR